MALYDENHLKIDLQNVKVLENLLFHASDAKQNEAAQRRSRE